MALEYNLYAIDVFMYRSVEVPLRFASCSGVTGYDRKLRGNPSIEDTTA